MDRALARSAPRPSRSLLATCWDIALHHRPGCRRVGFERVPQRRRRIQASRDQSSDGFDVNVRLGCPPSRGRHELRVVGGLAPWHRGCLRHHSPIGGRRARRCRWSRRRHLTTIRLHQGRVSAARAYLATGFPRRGSTTDDPRLFLRGSVRTLAKLRPPLVARASLMFSQAPEAAAAESRDRGRTPH